MNRIDEVIVFDPLDEEQIHAIVDQLVAEVQGASTSRVSGSS